MSTEIIDTDALLEDFEGDVDFMEEILQDTRNDILEYMDNLRETINHNDFEGMKIASHSIKGVCLTTKCIRGVDPSREIESISKQLLEDKSVDKSIIIVHMKKLEDEISEVIGYIDKILKKI